MTAAPAAEAMRSCKRGDFARQRRLVADARGQAPEQAGDFSAGLHEAEDIVHQQQHVLMLLVAEIFGDGHRRQRRAPARAGRLVHLAIDQNRALQHAGFAHFGPEFVAFARAFADAGENGNAAIFLDHGVDQLHHQHGLADAGAAKHRRLAALRERRQQVDHFDAGLENLRRGRLVLQARRRIVDRPARRHRPARRAAIVPDIAEHVEQPAEHSARPPGRTGARRSPERRRRAPVLRSPEARWRARSPCRYGCELQATSVWGRSQRTVKALLTGGRPARRRNARPRPRRGRRRPAPQRSDRSFRIHWTPHFDPRRTTCSEVCAPLG